MHPVMRQVINFLKQMMFHLSLWPLIYLSFQVPLTETPLASDNPFSF